MDYEFSFEEADALLMRDWFYQDEDIDELLWLLTEEVFQQVYEKRFEYPYRVSLALRMHEPIKTKAKDFTDKMMDDMLEKEEIERINQSKKDRDAFVCLPRPRNELDDEYDELKKKSTSNRISEVQRQLEIEDRYWKDSQWVLFTRTLYEI